MEPAEGSPESGPESAPTDVAAVDVSVAKAPVLDPAVPAKHARTTRAGGGNTSALRPDPAATASWLSFLFWSYLDGLVEAAYKRGLSVSDVWATRGLSSGDVSAAFTKEWNRRLASESQPTVASVFRTLFLGQYLRAFSIYLLRVCCQVSIPVVVRSVVLYLEDTTDSLPTWHPWVFGALIICVPILESCLFFHATRKVFMVAVKMRSALSTAVYNKSLRLASSNSGRQGTTTGGITNLVATDARRLLDGAIFTNMCIASPLLIIVCMGFLVSYLGVAAFVGFGFYVLLLPVTSGFSGMMMRFGKARLGFMDSRIKATNEALQGIRAIRLYGWEESMINTIQQYREREAVWLKKFIYANGVNTLVFTITPVISSAVTFAVYSALGNELTASTIFPSIAFFILIRIPMILVPLAVSMGSELVVSFRRITTFLMLPEQDGGRISLPHDGRNGIKMTDAVFSWGGDDKGSGSAEAEAASATKNADKSGDSNATGDAATPAPAFQLGPITLDVPAGGLVVVVGKVGSGKTSLCNAVLGEMLAVRGGVTVHGTVAYVPQTAFVINDTVKANILFGRHFHPELYERTIAACALKSDLELLPKGDKTFVGDRGITLSGGQKARVSLARAMYSQADIVVLDDPTAAVDAWVGEHLFHKCINGALKRRTRVYVTNHIEQAKSADVVVVMEGGRITAHGSYDEVVASSAGFQNLLEAYTAGDEDEEAAAEAGDAEAKTAPGEGEFGDAASAGSGRDRGRSASRDRSVSRSRARTLSTDRDRGASAPAENDNVEEQAQGAISLKLVMRYLKSGGSGCYVACVILFMFLGEFFRTASEVWLAVWTEDKFELEHMQYLGIYAGISSGTSLVLLAVTVLVVLLVLGAGNSMHARLLTGVLRSPMTFFDSTPAGRVLNRFSKDLGSTDQNMHQLLVSSGGVVFNVMVQVTVIVVVMPFMIVLLAIVGIFYYKVQARYRPSSRDVQRVESITNSPLYGHLSETLNGVSSIRAYGHTDRFIRTNEAVLDRANAAFFIKELLNQWLGIRLNFLGSITMFTLSILCMVFRDFVDPGLAALAINYALFVTQSLQWGVQNIVKLEAQLTSVERIFTYADLTPEAYQPTNVKPHATWPSGGDLEFESVSLRYRPELPLVLRDLSFQIPSGTMAAVVGRTGAGKSSLIMSLFRLVEPCAGKITLDGLDIGSLGLDHLRQSRIAIIPQDPTLFSGTVRYNIDPFSSTSDAAIWEAVRLAGLGSAIGSLDDEVAEDGQNFSVGQRQLLCLCRALIREPRLLVLDEATASVDATTDSLVQEVVRSRFHNGRTTIITIAHRLNTIMDYDTVLVMADGQLAEMGSPQELLDQATAGTGGALFASMVDAGGPEVSARLRAAAARAAGVVVKTPSTITGKEKAGSKD